MLNIKEINLRKLNSLTKYPSINTYHVLNPKNGLLTNETYPFEGELFLTEKVDGTNGRIIYLPDGNYIIGSREELLYAKGDIIENPKLSIVETLKPVAEKRLNWKNTDVIATEYFEVYGGNVGKHAKEYTTNRSLGFRLFDVSILPKERYEELFTRELAAISSWRTNGGQEWFSERELNSTFGEWDLTPRLGRVNDLPSEFNSMLEFLSETIDQSKCKLNPDANGTPEGIVVRSEDRSFIYKIRFQDYKRTLKRMKK